MVEQSRAGVYTQIVYGPGGGKFALMSGQTLSKAFVPLSGGATAVYTSSGLNYYRHADCPSADGFASTPVARVKYSDAAYAPFGEPYAESGSTDRNFTGQNPDTTAGRRRHSAFRNVGEESNHFTRRGGPRTAPF